MKPEHTSARNLARALAAMMVVGLMWAARAQAQVPPEIAAQIKQIGPVVDARNTAKIYRPLQPRQPYEGVTVVRDIPYGSNPRQVLDVFVPAVGGSARTVLLFIPGGGGSKIEPIPDGDAFYDNILLWATKNGMTGVNMQRLAGADRAWDDPARDVGVVIQWIHDNIAKYQGNPNRVFAWAHSAGNTPLGTYIAHPNLYPASGVGVLGVIMLGGNFNILPVVVNAPATPPRGGGAANAPPPVDPATELAHSNLPGLQKTRVPLFIGAGEIDSPRATGFLAAIKPELCKVNHCPTTAVFKDHGHMSSVFSPNTADDSVTGPILKFIRAVK